MSARQIGTEISFQRPTDGKMDASQAGVGRLYRCRFCSSFTYAGANQTMLEQHVRFNHMTDFSNRKLQHHQQQQQQQQGQQQQQQQQYQQQKMHTNQQQRPGNSNGDSNNNNSGANINTNGTSRKGKQRIR